MKHVFLTLALSTLLATTAQAYEIQADANNNIQSISGIEYEGQSYSVNFEDIVVTATNAGEYPYTSEFTAESFPELTVSRDTGFQIVDQAIGIVNDIITGDIASAINPFIGPISFAWSSGQESYYLNTYEIWGTIYSELGEPFLDSGETIGTTFAIVTPDEDPETSPVPVPSSLVLLAMGMLTLTGARKYRMSGNLH